MRALLTSLLVGTFLVVAPIAATADCNGAASGASTASTPSGGAGHGGAAVDVGAHEEVFVEGPTIAARVAAIDPAQGQVTIETRGRTLTVLAPPDELADVKVGDTIHIALDEHTDGLR